MPVIVNFTSAVPLVQNATEDLRFLVGTALELYLLGFEFDEIALELQDIKETFDDHIALGDGTFTELVTGILEGIFKDLPRAEAAADTLTTDAQGVKNAGFHIEAIDSTSVLVSYI